VNYEPLASSSSFCGFVQSIAGQAVTKAAANEALFPLHKRDAMLDYIMALMRTPIANTLSSNTVR
jgi:anti-sigma factor ChrR (cupin superfamily)